MHGASNCFSDTFDITSEISSSVPVPPGNAINASPSSIIFVFRSVISFVTISSVKLSYCNSASMKNFGSTPVTVPPACRTLSAISPINPDFDPPYTSAFPLAPIHVPSSRTACFRLASFPSKAPKYTVMFMFFLAFVLDSELFSFYRNPDSTVVISICVFSIYTVIPFHIRISAYLIISVTR